MELGNLVGSLLRRKVRRKREDEKDQRKKTFSTASNSNLSTSSFISCNSASVIRKSIVISLSCTPDMIGCQFGIDGRIVSITQGSPAHSSGVMQIGDFVRVLHSEVIKYGDEDDEEEEEHVLTLQVTFAVLFAEERPVCHLIVEIGNRSNTSFGICLADSDDEENKKIRISSIQPGSLADRCGYLKSGDILTSIHLNCKQSIPCSPYYSSFQVAQILRRISSRNSTIKLTISPGAKDEFDGISIGTEINGSNSTLLQQDEEERVNYNNCSFNTRNSCPTEAVLLSVCLWKDRLYEDWGFSLIDENDKSENNELSDERKGAYINQIRKGGPAFIAGLEGGDKIIQINDKEVSNVESTILVPMLASLDDALNLVVARNLN